MNEAASRAALLCQPRGSTAHRKTHFYILYFLIVYSDQHSAANSTVSADDVTEKWMSNCVAVVVLRASDSRRDI